jgi:ABC-type branched-subunit amino acid transport system ATPase component
MVRTKATSAKSTATEPQLEAAELTVRYGGLVAVDNFSFSALSRAITGLIGPNGAGKTTTLNACSGLVPVSAGTVNLGGVDITRKSTAARARLGIGRTFQQMELFESLTVRDNVRLGVEGSMAGRSVARQVVSSPRQRNLMNTACHDAIAECGLEDLANEQVSFLTTGQRRLVELARCLAGSFRFLLLDEPSSGLDRYETERIGRILRSVVEQRHIGILLVEHDMSLVMNVCDAIYVADFGSLIFTGTPDQVRSSAVVRAAYLGEVDDSDHNPGLSARDTPLYREVDGVRE